MQLSSTVAVGMVEHLRVQGSNSKLTNRSSTTHFNSALEFGVLTQYRFKGGGPGAVVNVGASRQLRIWASRVTRERPQRKVAASASPHDLEDGGSSSLQPP